MQVRITATLLSFRLPEKLYEKYASIGFENGIYGVSGYLCLSSFTGPSMKNI